MINPLITNNVRDNPIIKKENNNNLNLFVKNIYNMEGGFFINKIKFSLKLTLDTLKKIIPDYVKNNLDEFNKYDFGYVITDLYKNQGIYLIKKELFNIVKIKKIKGTEFIDRFITNKFLSYRFIVINID